MCAPAEFVELRLSPLKVLHVGVEQGDEEEVLSPHRQQVLPHLLHSLPVLYEMSPEMEFLN
jgi:hypothetical protein